MDNFKDRLQKNPVLVDALLLTKFNDIRYRNKKIVYDTFSSPTKNAQICITISTFFHVFSKSRRGRGIQNGSILRLAFAVFSLVFPIRTQEVKLQTNFDHFKYSLRVNKKTFGMEYSSFVKPSSWNCLHLDWINLYRNDFVQKRPVTLVATYVRSRMARHNK